jgi:hypothetical protein
MSKDGQPLGSAEVHGGEDRLHVAEVGEDDGRGLYALRRKAAQQFKAVHAGHLQAGQQDGGRLRQQFIEGFLAVGGGIGGEAPAADHRSKFGALPLFVLGNEDAGDGSVAVMAMG